MPLPDQLAEKPNGLVIARSNLTVAELEEIPDRRAKKGLRLAEEIFGEPPRQLLARIKNPNLQKTASRELAAVILASERTQGEPHGIFAAVEGFQSSVVVRSGHVRKVDALKVAREDTRLILAAQDELNGDVMVVKARDAYRRRVGFVSSKTVERAREAVGKAKKEVANNCDKVDISANVSSTEFWLSGSLSGLQEVEKRLTASDFRSTPLHLERLQLGLPLHSEYMVPYKDDLLRARDNVEILPSDSTLISNLTGRPVSSDVSPSDIFDPTRASHWAMVDQALNDMGFKERLDLDVDNALSKLAPYVTKRRVGMLGIGLGIGAAAVGGWTWWNRRKG